MFGDAAPKPASVTVTPAVPPWHEGLTRSQREAVDAPDGPVLVLAGAGTGKTTTLACRVARLLADGTLPERVLLLTFTRRAARELVGRATRMVARGAPHAQVRARGAAGRVAGGTFHAVGNRLLRRHGHTLGLDPSFTVLDAADAADLLDVVRTDLGLDRRQRRFPRKATLAAIYSRTVNAARPLSEVLGLAYPWCADEVEAIGACFSGYTARKRQLGVLDYDDLLLWWRALLEQEAVAERVSGAFDHILVDEYQDTNRLQADVLARMGSGHRNVTVVGDDAQAIYGFRAATVDNILRFCDEWPGATVVRLEDNHRSTAQIVATANAVIVGASQRWDTTLRSPRTGPTPTLVVSVDEERQAEDIGDAVLARREDGVALREQAVLMRTSSHSASLELELRRRGIPFVKYGGLRFLEAAHVKDLVALLRILENDADELAWFRVLQWYDGVGPATARRLLGELRNGPRGPLAALLAQRPSLPPGAVADVERLRAALGACAAAGPGDRGLPVADQISRLARAYEPVCTRRFDDAGPRLRDLEQLAAIAADAPDRTAFLADLVLDPPSSTADVAGAPLLDEDWLVLSTIHSAKGLEWDSVHVLGLADGMLPSDMATGSAEEVDEERRLLYVAVTRARRRLVLHQPQRCYVQRFGVGDRHVYAQPSRFLDDRVRSTLERRAPLEPAAADAHEPAAAAIDRWLSGLWS